MMFREVPFGAVPFEPGRARFLTAMLLHAASILLGRLALRLMPAQRELAGDPVLEFYAQAGAPEGALYVDGELVARLPGVSRL
jgi:hypothetical protein